MTDAWQSIKIRRFELITAGAATSLLRVTGKPPWRRSASQRPTLVLDKDDDAHRFAPLPAPEDPRGMLRAAYSVPSELIAPDSKFWLEHSDGALTELPQPTPGTARGEPHTAESATASSPIPPGRVSNREPAQPGPPPEVEHERRSDVHAKMAEQSADLAQSERAAAESDQARRLSEAELARAREAIQTLERRLAEHDAERENDRPPVGDALAAGETATQQRIADAEAQAAKAEARATAAEDRAQSVMNEATATQERLQEIERRNQRLEQTVLEQAERIESLNSLAVETRPEQSVLEQELAVLRSSRASLEDELDQSRDQLRMMTFERDELSRQAAAFDGVAVKARERATKAEAQNKQLSATLRELETWRAELERRLAATTSELGAAKTARQADERELKRLLAAAESGAQTSAVPSGESAETIGGQAAEIELLAAEVASLRAEREAADAGGREPAGEDTGRIAKLEAERAEIARRADHLSAALQEALRPAQLLAELARSDPDENSDTGTDTHIELISQSAERAAREQAERELQAASREYSDRGRGG